MSSDLNKGTGLDRRSEGSPNLEPGGAQLSPANFDQGTKTEGLLIYRNVAQQKLSMINIDEFVVFKEKYSLTETLLTSIGL